MIHGCSIRKTEEVSNVGFFERSIRRPSLNQSGSPGKASDFPETATSTSHYQLLQRGRNDGRYSPGSTLSPYRRPAGPGNRSRERTPSPQSLDVIEAAPMTLADLFQFFFFIVRHVLTKVLATWTVQQRCKQGYRLPKLQGYRNCMKLCCKCSTAHHEGNWTFVELQ